MYCKQSVFFLELKTGTNQLFWVSGTQKTGETQEKLDSWQLLYAKQECPQYNNKNREM